MDIIINYEKSEYLETPSGNKISKKSIIKGTDQIQVAGRCIFLKDFILRGDLSKISIGKYVLIFENVLIKPSYSHLLVKETNKKQLKFLQISVGDYVTIEQGTIIQAQKIGTCVQIGKNCVIGHRCQIGENSIILEDSILAPDSIVPPNSVFGGRPATYLQETPETTSIIQKQRVMAYYKNFQPK